MNANHAARSSRRDVRTLPQGACRRGSRSAPSQSRLTSGRAPTRRCGTCSRSARGSTHWRMNLPVNASPIPRPLKLLRYMRRWRFTNRAGNLIYCYRYKRAIHEAIVAAAGNPVLYGLYDSITARIRRDADHTTPTGVGASRARSHPQRLTTLRRRRALPSPSHASSPQA